MSWKCRRPSGISEEQRRPRPQMDGSSDRENFAESIEYEGPIDTDSDKAALVDYYVDTAVRFED